MYKNIFQAKESDYQIIGNLMYESRMFALPFIEHKYSKESYFDFIKSNVATDFNILIYREKSDYIQGFIAYGSGWIEHLYLSPESIGKGIGAKLLSTALEELNGDLQLWTFKENHRAIKFYKKYGFEVVEESSDNEEDVLAVRMVLSRS